MSEWKITLTTPDGDEMVVHPASEATHGVYLAEDQVKGDIIDAPVHTEWDSLALQEGGTQRGTDYEYRDIHLGFHVTDDVMTAAEADSMLRMKLAYELDEWDPNPITETRLTLESELSGERHLDVVLANTPGLEFARDPDMNQYYNPQFTVRAAHPMWYQLINGQPYKMTAYDMPTSAGTHEGTIEVENPTDRAARHSWVIGMGIGTKVWLPDVSWVGPKGFREVDGPYADRMVQLPTITADHGGGFVVTLESGRLMIRDFNNTNVLGQMPVPGTRFLNRIPFYTRKTTLPIHIESAPTGGGRIELRMPTKWSRPLGLEMW